MAFSGLQDGKCVPFDEKWNIFGHVGNSLYLMTRYCHGVVSCVPLYVHRFRFLQPHFLFDSERFNIACTDPSQFATVGDKLRYYRYRNGLLQRDVADHAGIERTTYTDYEDNVRDYYPLDVLARIADLLEVDISALLDDYNSFLYYGQAQQVRAARQGMGLTQAAFAAVYGVQTPTVKRWEQCKIRMSKVMWEKVFKS